MRGVYPLLVKKQMQREVPITPAFRQSAAKLPSLFGANLLIIVFSLIMVLLARLLSFVLGKLIILPEDFLLFTLLTGLVIVYLFVSPVLVSFYHASTAIVLDNLDADGGLEASKNFSSGRKLKILGLGAFFVLLLLAIAITVSHFAVSFFEIEEIEEAYFIVLPLTIVEFVFGIWKSIALAYGYIKYGKGEAF
jgi:hypothetical protein